VAMFPVMRGHSPSQTGVNGLLARASVLSAIFTKSR